MNSKNYRVMKFFESVNKQNKSKGYVRLDIRGIRGNLIVSVESLGDAKTTSEVYLYKDKANKIKLGDINNKKGLIKKMLTFGSNSAIEDYNICAVVKDKKIVMYTNLFNTCSFEQIRKLEVDEDENMSDGIAKLQSTLLEKEVVNAETVDNTESVESEQQEAEESYQEAKDERLKEVIKEVKKEEKVHEEIKETEVKQDVQYEAAKSDPEIDEVKNASVSEAVNMNEAIIEPEKDEEPEIGAQGRKYRNRFDESLYNVLKDYKQVEPLSVKIKKLYWWYIPYDETGIKNGFLPYYNQVISSYYPYPMSNRVTTCSGLMRKYGHYIFGIYKENDDIAKFVYGVPGEFTKEEQPYKGITGFKNWSYSNKENYDKHGYWLAFVNPRTGATTEPPNIELS